MKKSALVLFVLLASSIAFALDYEASDDSLKFNLNERNEKLLVIETETEPLLVSYKFSSSVSDLIEVDYESDLKVTKQNSLVLRINLNKNPINNINGYIIIDAAYENPPDKLDYSDNTLVLPIVIDNSDFPNEKVYVKFTEPEVVGGSEIPLATEPLLIIILLVLLLFMFKRKWLKT